jgi:hypothetical protein
MPACFGVPGTMILDEVPPDAFFASSSSFLFFAVLHDRFRQREECVFLFAVRRGC